MIAASGAGLWIALTEEVEVPGWHLGLGYAALSGVGIALGVGLRSFSNALRA
jgi:hypothetical protein